MSDRYAQLIRTPVGKFVAGNVGLPQPVELDRYEFGEPVVRGTVLFGTAPGGRLAEPVARVLASAGADTATALKDDARPAAAKAGLDASVWSARTAPDDQRFKAIVFDATGIKRSDDLRELWAFFSPTIRRVQPSGRVIVLGTPPEECGDPKERTAQRAVEGFTRSVAKEVRRGSSCNLVHVSPGAEGAIESTLRFFLSPRSAYVSAQVVHIGAGEAVEPADWDRALAGKRVLVTGASRGIGEAIAETLARDGASVIGLDVPQAEEALREVMDRISGEALPLDITDGSAPRTIAKRFGKGGLDVVVHNAGITRDKTLGRMDEDRWTTLMDINLSSEERINDALLEAEVLGPGGRIICVSSISGVAGNAGQTNYATSKAGVIGMVQALAPVMAEHGATINAVAPGFIETAMTHAMPLAAREAGRRMNSMQQGGLPVDVAETIGWLASPASGAINGNVVRVCGQSLIGA